MVAKKHHGKPDKIFVSSQRWTYTPIHLYYAAPSWIAWRTNSRLDGHKVEGCVTLQCFEWGLQANIVHNHCCVNFCSNNKRNESGENLPFFNFPLNDLLRSKWIAASRQDEGPDLEVRVASWLVSCQIHVQLAIDFPFHLQSMTGPHDRGVLSFFFLAIETRVRPSCIGHLARKRLCFIFTLPYTRLYILARSQGVTQTNWFVV